MRRTLPWITLACSAVATACIPGVFLSEWGWISIDESVFHGTQMLLAPVTFLSSSCYLLLNKRLRRSRDAALRNEAIAPAWPNHISKLAFYLSGAYLSFLLFLGVLGSFVLSDF